MKADAASFSAIPPAANVAGRPRQGMLKLAPVPRETVQDRVYFELRKALINGLFTPGQVLTIRELAATLQTSTMPVREALSRLISERALEELANRSVRVPLVHQKRLDDLLQARILVEGAALELATPRLESHDLEQLKVLVRKTDRMKSMRDGDPLEYALDLNRAFHFLIYQAAGSDVLIPIIESLWLQSGPYLRAATQAFDHSGPLSTQHYHSEIIVALEARDALAARAALVADIGRAFDLLRAQPDLGVAP